MIAYLGWEIRYNPKPIPNGNFDWDASHEDLELMITGSSFNDVAHQVDEYIIEEKENDKEMSNLWSPSYRK